MPYPPRTTDRVEAAGVHANPSRGATLLKSCPLSVCLVPVRGAAASAASTWGMPVFPACDGTTMPLRGLLGSVTLLKSKLPRNPFCSTGHPNQSHRSPAEMLNRSLTRQESVTNELA